MILTISIEPGTVARLNETIYRNLERAIEAKKALMDQHGIASMELASEISPYDTGFMSSHVTYTPLRDGPYDFEVGWYQEDFDRAGHPPYYVFQEFGTIHHAAQPTLGPVFRSIGPDLKREAIEMLRREMGAA